MEKPGSERGINALQQLEEDEAFGVVLPNETVAAGMGAFSTRPLVRIVTEGHQRVLGWVGAERFPGRNVSSLE